MPLSAYNPDPKRYEEIFGSSVQGGGNMVRYRGAAYQNGTGFPQVLKALLAKFAALARPVLRAAAPHARRAFEVATPHLREAATSAARNITERATDAIVQRLEESLTTALAAGQAGHGGRRRRLKASPKAAPPAKRLKRLQRIPPHHLPDFF